MVCIKARELRSAEAFPGGKKKKGGNWGEKEPGLIWYFHLVEGEGERALQEK